MLRSRAVMLTCMIVPILLPVVVWILIATTAVNVPYWDEWEWAELVYKFHVGTLTFADLWSQHNEHRILFPQLILLGLDRFGGWSPVREQFVTLFFAVCAQIGLFVLIRRSFHGTAGSVVGALVSIVLYGLWQSENFTWGFQMAWLMCNAAAIAVIALLARLERNIFDVAGAILIAIVASYSLSQGLIVWLVGILAILFRQRDIARILSPWLFFAICTVLFYVHGLGASSVTHINVFAHPLGAAHYLAVYLGSPIGHASGASVSAVAGLAVLVAVGSAFWFDVRSELRRRHFLRRGPYYALAAFGIVTGALTVFGRSSLGIDQALSSRYTSVSGLVWIAAICIVATLVVQMPQLSTRVRRTHLPTIAATLCALLLFQSEADGWRTWNSTEDNWADARRGLERSDPAALAKLYPDQARIEMLLDEMRRVHDGPFTRG